MSSSTSVSSSRSSFQSPPLRPRPRPASSKTNPSESPRGSNNNILLFLIAFRLLNALTVRTFFQPDEFFQSLEPAWQIAFGESQGPWITWEWTHQLRSSLHPLIFAAVYSSADLLARAVRLAPASRADLLVAAPGITQAVIAALGDFYTWKLAKYVYGSMGYEAWATLVLTVLSPWQWFCSTRTLSNCLETTITIVALYSWPWEWSLGSSRGAGGRGTNSDDNMVLGYHRYRLRRCLLLAAFACILRPTNIIIWICLATAVLYRSSWASRKILVREAVLCGSTVLAISLLSDRVFYGIWTFPPLRFLHFNIAQSLAVFYGRNDWHYYASQGYPLLLTTALPFALVGLYRGLTRAGSRATPRYPILLQLSSICLIMPISLSLISHKEVRFIYPLLPSLHILSASPVVDFFLPAISSTNRRYTPRRLTFIFLVLVNIVIAVYTTVFHASGVISVLSYLRDQHEIHGTAIKPAAPKQASSAADGFVGITAGFLMPCHSTPWRSHLVEPSIHGWALSCEPPVGLSEAQKAVYRDEADQFYDNPKRFLRDNMVGGLRYIPRRPSYRTHPSQPSLATQRSSPHEWPDYLIFFAQLEPTLNSLLRSSSYGECWRTYNTAWHDDWRRRGDVVVWCLDPNEQQSWRAEKRKREVEERDRQFDRVIQSFKREAGGSKKSSSFQWWWTSPSSTPSWSWPWERRKRVTLFGIQLPDVSFPTWKLPSWKWPGFGKKKSKATNRDLWS
ncbi:hypothetical protein P175DRAFT_0427956 [Aspergillus ochraceoroseus IBT 24754]|uniref:Mannosyltransferase n=1 Tax=Aspergillus ochraceoroseus IBT 24754 TaxID=1392256 RepID=A0A2T5M6L8_9EURO|nr:uncharacterized protein P175DRAFT_0427956 [Aspergillus ochraceoroseus IBT 24754]PTU24169.1 hypothetical protein P175DRAFT_0427956 [Aspergillus ochraceoroseus IBT 24754]